MIDAAERFVALRPGAVVILARDVEVIRPTPPAAPHEGVSAYDAAILDALTENPLSPKRLARASGRRFNSYFRERLGKLVDVGLARRTRRGYARP